MKKTILFLLALGLSLTAGADEGMWMVSTVNRALEAKMQERGLKLSAGEIYNVDADGTSLCDAIVSLDFMCSGSVVSDDGLVITNHHCAYSDVFALSTDEHNYLEEGYWAFYRKDEIPIPGKGIQFLQKVLDVTDEVNALTEEYGLEGKPLGSRKLSYLIEKKYEQETGLEASLDIMWSGSKYYLSLYKTYKDIRLVAAPPVSIAAFGGDIDNWEWPQHKGDFAMYRIYTAPDGSPAEYSEDNVPLRPRRKLTVSTDGYSEGSYAMVIGYPGRTSRYSSSAKVASTIDVTMPVSTEIRGQEMAIIKRWMDADPTIRLKYSDWYFGLSNVQELNEGEILCCNRFGVVADLRKQEAELQEWIDADPERKARWGGVIPALNAKWEAVEDIERVETYARETLIRATKLGLFCLRLQSNKTAREHLVEWYRDIDLRVENDLFMYSLGVYYNNVDRKYWGSYQTSLWERFGGDVEAVGKYIIENTLLSDIEKVKAFAASDESIAGDPMFSFFNDVRMVDFNNIVVEIDGTPDRLELGREYTRALYAMREDKGMPQYPDANSSMRITYGTVGGIEPHDAVVCDWKTSTRGILEKYSETDYDFSLKPYWKDVVGNYTGPVDFLTDNDITGGNSGSAVMNAKGEIIGLAFDGNKESLASDFMFTPGYNKCVCVDIRYVLFILRTHGMDAVLAEMGQK